MQDILDLPIGVLLDLLAEREKREVQAKKEEVIQGNAEMLKTM